MDIIGYIILGIAIVLLVVSIGIIIDPNSEYNKKKREKKEQFKGTDDTEEMKAKFAEAEKRSSEIYQAQQEQMRRNWQESERNKEEAGRRLQKEDEMRKRVQQLNTPSIPMTPEKHEKIEIDCYSPNNRINCVAPVGKFLVCDIDNTVTGRSEVVKLDSKKDVKDFLEIVFDCWREQEKDLVFHPFASFNFKTRKNIYVAVVGMKFREEEALHRLGTLDRGAMMLLVPERSNEQDEDAIRVFTADGYLVGYVSMNDGYKVMEISDGIVIGWMSTYWVKGKQRFNVALVKDKCMRHQINKEDITDMYHSGDLNR